MTYRLLLSISGALKKVHSFSCVKWWIYGKLRILELPPSNFKFEIDACRVEASCSQIIFGDTLFTVA